VGVIRISNAVWDHSASTGVARLVLLAIADRASIDGVAWPGQADLVRRANASARSVERAVADLVALGELEVRTYSPTGERTRRNVYRICLPGVVEDVDYARLEEKKIYVHERFTTRQDDGSSKDRRPDRLSATTRQDGGSRARVQVEVQPSIEPPGPLHVGASPSDNVENAENGTAFAAIFDGLLKAPQ
jgi:hypothetical protein